MRTTTKEQWLRGALVAVVLFHTIVHLWHSTTHFQIPVPLTAAQIALVVVVVLVLPLLGAGLLWTTRKREAAWLITVSMLVSLLFGFISHFVISGPTFRTVNWWMCRIVRRPDQGGLAPAGEGAAAGAPGPRQGQGRGGYAADRPLRNTGTPNASSGDRSVC